MTSDEEARARQTVSLTLGEDDEAVLHRILRDLATREGMSYAQIAALSPVQLDELDDRYGWMG